jgi:hypothetical protein
MEQWYYASVSILPFDHVHWPVSVYSLLSCKYTLYILLQAVCSIASIVRKGTSGICHHAGLSIIVIYPDPTVYTNPFQPCLVYEIPKYVLVVCPSWTTYVFLLSRF